VKLVGVLVNQLNKHFYLYSCLRSRH